MTLVGCLGLNPGSTTYEPCDFSSYAVSQGRALVSSSAKWNDNITSLIELL